MAHYWVRNVCLDFRYSSIVMSEQGKVGTLETGPNARQHGFAGDLSQISAPQVKERSQNMVEDFDSQANVDDDQETRGNHFSENPLQGDQNHRNQNLL